MADSQASRATASQPQEGLSKRSRIVVMLAELGVRRQAKLDDQDYQVYARDLADFDERDIQKSCDRIALQPRRDGQTSFPDIATLISEIDRVEGYRLIAQRKLPDHIQKAVDEDRASTLRLEAGERVESIKSLLTSAKTLEIEPTKHASQRLVPCSHCNLDSSATDSRSIRRIEAFYRSKAEAAEARERSGVK